jgi:hypothetical protein
MSADPSRLIPPRSALRAVAKWEADVIRGAGQQFSEIADRDEPGIYHALEVMFHNPARSPLPGLLAELPPETTFHEMSSDFGGEHVAPSLPKFKAIYRFEAGKVSVRLGKQRNWRTIWEGPSLKLTSDEVSSAPASAPPPAPPGDRDGAG